MEDAFIVKRLVMNFLTKSNRKNMKKKSKKISLAKLKKKACKIMSNYIRIMASNADGFAECVTCKTVKPWKELQNGHFIPGRRGWILFNEDCQNPQCYVCNVILKGNWPAYYEYMLEKHGLEKVHALIKLKNKPMSSTEMLEECERVISLYGGIKAKNE